MIDLFLRCWFRLVVLAVCSVIAVAFLLAFSAILFEFGRFAIGNSMQFGVAILTVISVISVIYTLKSMD